MFTVTTSIYLVQAPPTAPPDSPKQRKHRRADHIKYLAYECTVFNGYKNMKIRMLQYVGY